MLRSAPLTFPEHFLFVEQAWPVSLNTPSAGASRYTLTRVRLDRESAADVHDSLPALPAGVDTPWTGPERVKVIWEIYEREEKEQRKVYKRDQLFVSASLAMLLMLTGSKDRTATL
jgi:hypothetical protein